MSQSATPSAAHPSPSLRGWTHRLDNLRVSELLADPKPTPRRNVRNGSEAGSEAVSISGGPTGSGGLPTSRRRFFSANGDVTPRTSNPLPESTKQPFSVRNYSVAGIAKKRSVSQHQYSTPSQVFSGPAGPGRDIGRRHVAPPKAITARRTDVGLRSILAIDGDATSDQPKRRVHDPNAPADKASAADAHVSAGPRGSTLQAPIEHQCIRRLNTISATSVPNIVLDSEPTSRPQRKGLQSSRRSASAVVGGILQPKDDGDAASAKDQNSGSAPSCHPQRHSAGRSRWQSTRDHLFGGTLPAGARPSNRASVQPPARQGSVAEAVHHPPPAWREAKQSGVVAAGSAAAPGDPRSPGARAHRFAGPFAARRSRSSLPAAPFGRDGDPLPPTAAAAARMRSSSTVVGASDNASAMKSSLAYGQTPLSPPARVTRSSSESRSFFIRGGAALTTDDCPYNRQRATRNNASPSVAACFGR